MERLSPTYIVGLIFFFAAFLGGGEVLADNGWGETIGPVYATVRGTDGPGGLSVRSAPYERSPVLGHLDVGTQIRAYNRFTNGWVQIRTPIPSGWLRIDQLEPLGGEAVVSGVDRPEGCLRIRSGPSTATDVIGCVNLGENLWLTGIWSEGPWAQVTKPVPGWVYTPQILSSLSPPDTPTRVVYSRPPPRTATIVTSPDYYYYDPAPFWSGLLFRYWDYPYRKFHRYARRHRGYDHWNYPVRKYNHDVRGYQGYNARQYPVRTYRGNIGHFRGNDVRNYSARNFNTQVRSSIGNTASRFGNRNWGATVGPRGGMAVRAGRTGFGTGPRGGFNMRGRRR